MFYLTELTPLLKISGNFVLEMQGLAGGFDTSLCVGSLGITRGIVDGWSL